MRKKFGSYVFISFFISFLLLTSGLSFSFYLYAKKQIEEEKINDYRELLSEIVNSIERENLKIYLALDTIEKIINSRIPQAEKQKQFELIFSLFPEIKKILILDKDYTVTHVYPFDDEFIGLDLSSMSFIKLAKKEQKRKIMPHVCLIEKTLHYTMFRSIKNEHILLYLDIDWIKPFFEKFSDFGLYTFGIDEKGTVTFHLKRHLAEEEMNLKNLDAVKTALKGNEGPFIEYIDNGKYFLLAKKIEELNWIVFMGEKYNEAFSILKYTQRAGIIFYTISLILSFLLSIVLTQILKKPVSILLSNIEMIKKGDYSVKVPKDSFEEMAEIFESLKNMSKEVKDREYRFKKLFSESKTPICLIKPTGEILDANPAFHDFLGFKEEEIKNQGLNLFSLFIDSEYVKKMQTEMAKSDYLKDEEIEIKSSNGDILNVLFTSTALKDKDENLESYLIILFDLTEKKKLMDQIFLAQKMESIGRLTGGVAHDFNNLLTVIYGNAQLLNMKYGNNEDIKKYVESIMKAVNKGKDFIKSLLAFSKKQILELKVYDLNEAILEDVKLLKASIRDDIELELNLIDKPCPVKFDKTQLTQILLNLTTNAIDAMPNGGKIRIETDIKKIDSYYVKFHPNAKEGIFGVIKFSDTGVGIPNEMLTKIFDPFFTTKERGTGLGLSVVHGIVSQHGGFVTVYSELKKGTTFKIHLPISTEHFPEESTVSVKDLNLSGKKVLLVEDNMEVLILVKELLENLNLTVYATSDSTEAIELFKSKKDEIELCLLDVIMPQLSGFSLYEILSEIKPDLKVLFLTGYTDNVVHVNHILKKGMHILNKPFTQQELIKKINEILNS